MYQLCGEHKATQSEAVLWLDCVEGMVCCKAINVEDTAPKSASEQMLLVTSVIKYDVSETTACSTPRRRSEALVDIQALLPER